MCVWGYSLWFIFLSWKLEATWISSSSRWFCCFCSVDNSCLTFCDPMDYSMSGFPVLHYLLEFAQSHVLWVSDAIQPSHPVIPLLLLPSIFPSIRVFSNELALHIRWPKYCSFNFSISSSNEYSGLISFRIDWFDLLSVQGTLKSLLQHHSLKASILWCSAFFMVQLSHPYMTTGKTIALTTWIFVGKVISLLFNTFSRFLKALLWRSKHLLVSWLLLLAWLQDGYSNHFKIICPLIAYFQRIFSGVRKYSCYVKWA